MKAACQCVFFVCLSLDTNTGGGVSMEQLVSPPFRILLKQVVELFEEVWVFSVSGNY